MAAINSTLQLAKIRGQIDAQQQIVADLESALQASILGQPSTLTQGSLADVVNGVQKIYDTVTDGSFLGAAFKTGVEGFVKRADGTVPNLNTIVPEQDVIRNMLYQARAILGEFRIEEQQWNVEVQEEKSRKKELTDFAKG